MQIVFFQPCKVQQPDDYIRDFIFNTVFNILFKVLSKWKSIRLVLLEPLGVSVQSFSVCVNGLAGLAS